MKSVQLIKFKFNPRVYSDNLNNLTSSMHRIPPKTNFEAIIHAYTQTTCTINTRYEKEFANLTLQGLKILEQMAEQYVLSKKRQTQETSASDDKTIKNGDRFGILKKKMVEQKDDVEKLVSYKLSAKKIIIQASTKKQSLNDYNNDNILQQMKRISVSDKFSFDDDENENHTQNIFPSNIKKNKHFLEDDLLGNLPSDTSDQPPAYLCNQSLKEVMETSNRKIQNTYDYKVQFDENSPEQVSQYMMTDYSSNSSSNDNDYRQEYREESLQEMLQENKPLFGGIFSGATNSQETTCACKTAPVFQKLGSNSSSSTLNFQHYEAKNLLNSPKKSQKNKRLYIRNKRIPKWAANPSQVSKTFMQQKSINLRQWFGAFGVENLNSNAVFSINQNYKRTSSAKWNYNKMFVQ